MYYTWAILDYEPEPTGESIAGNILSEQSAATVTQVESSNASNFARAETPEAGSSSAVSAEVDWRAWAICLWLGGIVVMLLRLIYVAVGGSRLRRQCKDLDDEQLLAIVEHLRKNIGIARRIRVAISEHISLDKGRTFEVRIIGEDGKPMPSVPVKLDYDTPWNHGFSRGASYTDAEGKLVLKRFNPNVPEDYWVVLKDVAAKDNQGRSLRGRAGPSAIVSDMGFSQ